MGYRSDGKLYLSEKAQALLPENLRKDLDNDWEENSPTLWSFYEWKWYPSYPDIKAWETFFAELEANDDISEEDWDFIAVGEDGAVHEHRTQSKFYTNTDIGVYNGSME